MLYSTAPNVIVHVPKLRIFSAERICCGVTKALTARPASRPTNGR
ncbi:hypothetical protein ACFV1L_14115 [Kitasatospora sp. NPDC059646]